MSALLALPHDIWCGKVSQFLDLSEIIRVDTAIVKSGNERATYLSNIAGSILNQQVELGGPRNHHIAWMNKHSISPATLVLQKGFSFEETAFPRLSSQTENLVFERDSILSDEHFQQIMDHCAPRIVSLTLLYCRFISAEAFLRCVSQCPKLTTCRVVRCMNIDEATLSAVPTLCPSLQHFTASRYKIELILLGFAGVRNLLSFECRSKISAADLSTIAAYMPHIQSLKLSTFSAVRTGITFDALCRGCSKLRVLHLTGFTDLLHTTGFIDLNDSAVGCITTHLPLLTELNISGSPHISYDGIAHIARAYPNLHVLNVSHCKNLQNDAIILLGSHCTSLTSLSVAHCTLLTDLAFRTLNYTTLTHLDVSGTDVNGSFLANALNKGSVLNSLNVSYCKRIFGSLVSSIPPTNSIRILHTNSIALTKVMWMKLCKLLPNLRRISCVNCTSVTNDVVQEFVLQHPLLKYFNVRDCKVSSEMMGMYSCLRAELLADSEY